MPISIILNIAQILSGDYKPNLENINTHNFIEKISSEFINFAVPGKIDFSIKNESNLESEFIADYYSAIEIFRNLLDNAFKFTEHGKVELRVFDEEGQVVFEVEDTGKGISEDYQDKIFTVFSQEETGYTRDFEGAGLGLALVYKFIEMNNAEINYETAINKGTKFKLKFRRAK